MNTSERVHKAEAKRERRCAKAALDRESRQVGDFRAVRLLLNWGSGHIFPLCFEVTKGKVTQRNIKSFMSHARYSERLFDTHIAKMMKLLYQLHASNIEAATCDQFTFAHQQPSYQQ